ncbi:DUF2884 family protein [Alteromonas sp. C1M14]|uniref:DUF2884 family protein n=1 Tax=Alteromonas sp. C1M14 TaxID=2841567 RepID=UPI001C084205|nr:DUF2884 family protein [Alteromonas sp. C1M14]MBU2976629.1 YggN family protein [Alteromonas sp. C1M14]
MKMPIFTTASLLTALLTAPVYAFDFNSDDCNVDLHGDMRWHSETLTVRLEDNTTLRISPEHVLTINGTEPTLTDEQQQWVSGYYTQIDTAIPMTLNITYDALELAGTAVNEALGEIFGSDSGLSTSTDDLFLSLRQEMDQHFYDEYGQVRIATEDFADDGWFNHTWDNQFEQQVEDLLAKSAGHILIAIGSQMLSNENGFDDFEQRMDNWEADFEQRVEAKAESLEDEAHALCQVLQKADYVENKMQTQIPGLASLNVFSLKGDSQLPM